MHCERRAVFGEDAPAGVAWTVAANGKSSGQMLPLPPFNAVRSLGTPAFSSPMAKASTVRYTGSLSRLRAV